jgi:hypothetical protein
VDCFVVGEGERKDVKLQGEGERHKGSEIKKPINHFLL